MKSGSNFNITSNLHSPSFIKTMEQTGDAMNSCKLLEAGDAAFYKNLRRYSSADSVKAKS